MRDRTLKILEATVREFIETEEPVSSARLCKRYEFGVKAAMVRSELETLADMGFLEHPYHSAGRIPSDRGFEFFAERAILDNFRPSAIDEATMRLFERREWPEFLETSFDDLGVLGAIRSGQETHTWGIENLVAHIDWRTQEEIRSVISDFVNIEKHIEKASLLIEETPEVFVGVRNPITKSKFLAVVGGMYMADSGPVTLLAVGPRHMNYPKVVNAFKNLKRATSSAKKTKSKQWTKT